MNSEQIMVISVMDKDRAGIVAEITEEISRLGGNLMDLRQSVLSGWFTMILSVGFSAETSIETVEKSITTATSSNISVALHDGDIAEPEISSSRYMLTTIADDRSGLVAAVSRFCCDKGANILDLASNVDSEQYTMMLLLDLAPIAQINAFRTELASFGQKHGLTLVLQHHDIFRAANEI